MSPRGRRSEEGQRVRDERKREHTRWLGSPVRRDSRLGNVLREKEEENEEKRMKKEEELPDFVRVRTKEIERGKTEPEPPLFYSNP